MKEEEDIKEDFSVKSGPGYLGENNTLARHQK
jgi:hypothetical protein